ncbi:MAG TPA: transketolase C-terminal domain-containing protein, partial [Syntrophorhabdaceae bacterium]|nr:transketolase C-terminal domain-containing protein [Syntrophorhabdaceae bacterium]
MSPKDENELRHMLYSAYMYRKPVAVRYPRGEVLGIDLDRDFYEIPLGKWEILKKGADIAIIATGNTVIPSLEASQILEKEGIKATVINGRFVKPMDREMLFEVASQVRKILTVEENTVIGGFGAGILEALSEEGILIPVKIMGLPDAFLPHGAQDTLRHATGLTKIGIAKKVLDWLRKE